MNNREKIKIFKTNIIGGKFKGRQIEIPDIGTTRSSKSILKESFFNTLQFDIMDKNFVEVFAGSGSVGLEALSRGASRCYFIEQNKTAFRVLTSNSKKLDSSKTTLVYGDSFEKLSIVLDMLKRDNKEQVKTYFYFDPPFSIRDGMDEIYEDSIKLIESIDIDICEMVTVEHMTSMDLPQEIGELVLKKKTKFGRSTLSYYIPKD
jgi:16S rRNA (guanine(966)-N(2))-methyltransferase RsmD